MFRKLFRKPTHPVCYDVRLTEELSAFLDQVILETNSNRASVWGRVFSLYRIAYTAAKEGKHIGLVSNPNKLDREIINI